MAASTTLQHEISLVALLKECAKHKDLYKGGQVHSTILESEGLLTKNPFIGNAVVNMYVKCGALGKAQEVFDELPLHDVVSWNILHTGYSQQGLGEKVLDCFERMQHEAVSPNPITISSILRACSSVGAVKNGKRIHACILIADDHFEQHDVGFVGERLLENRLVIGSALLDMYAKCGALVEAQQVFDGLPLLDVVSWTALIAGYCDHGHVEEALNCYEQMRGKGISPDAVTFACILKACSKTAAADKGKEIHAAIIRKGLLAADIKLESALLDMYAKCGAIARAKQLFEEVVEKDIVLWNALLGGYSQQGHGKEALKCFEQMQHAGALPDEATFACVLKACGSVGEHEKGKEVHAEIVRKGLLGNSLILGNSLVDMYAKCGALVQAQEVFDNLFGRDVVSWNALVAGYTQHEHDEDALHFYECMQNEGLAPTTVTLVCILKACSNVRAAGMDSKIHSEIERKGLHRNSTLLGNALVNMYVKHGELAKAQEVFDELTVWDVVSCNALITGLCEQGYGEEALVCYEKLKQRAISPSEVTLVCVLKACSIIEAVACGIEIHAEIARKGLLGSSTLLGSALVDMYVNCGWLSKAQEAFDEHLAEDVVSCNALIGGYIQYGRDKEALQFFERMREQGLSPDVVTFICVLKACGSLGAVKKGTEIHDEIMRSGLLLLGSAEVLGNALVDMYAKSGLLAKARKVFAELPVRDIVSWNSLIAGYCQQGLQEEALACFEQMEQENVSPDEVTFSCILKACGSMGAAERGQAYFETMTTRYGIIPTMEHHTCIVYLYGCAGRFEKAMAEIDRWPFPDPLAAWLVLMGACQKWGNVKLGKFAFEHAAGSDKKCAFAYTCMSRIYAAAGMQEDANKIEALRLENEAYNCGDVQSYWLYANHMYRTREKDNLE